MFYILKEWKTKTNNAYCYLSFDNAKIQATADLTELKCPHQQPEIADVIRLADVGEKLNLPAYSHDLNRPIEHVFGTMKHRIREELYFNSYKYRKPEQVQSLVMQQFKHNFPEKQVAEDVNGLPLLWEVLSVPAGITFVDCKGNMAVGTGGDWPNAEYR
jgi:hypothetical protein